MNRLIQDSTVITREYNWDVINIQPIVYTVLAEEEIEITLPSLEEDRTPIKLVFIYSAFSDAGVTILTADGDRVNGVSVGNATYLVPNSNCTVEYYFDGTESRNWNQNIIENSSLNGQASGKWYIEQRFEFDPTVAGMSKANGLDAPVATRTGVGTARLVFGQIIRKIGGFAYFQVTQVEGFRLVVTQDAIDRNILNVSAFNNVGAPADVWSLNLEVVTVI